VVMESIDNFVCEPHKGIDAINWVMKFFSKHLDAKAKGGAVIVGDYLAALIVCLIKNIHAVLLLEILVNFIGYYLP
jgi:hypothetical protein